jgi:hypothetical protein
MYLNAKIVPVQTIPGIRGVGHKGEWWRGRIQV